MMDPGQVSSVEQVVARFTRAAPPFARDAHLYRDLGIASIEALSLLFALEAELGVSLDDQGFIQSVTIETLSALVEGAR
jgi:acyl carrier protein